MYVRPQVALPALSATAAQPGIVVPSSVNRTVPSPDVGFTVAVNVTGCSPSDGLADEVNEVPLAAGTTDVTSLAGLQLPNAEPNVAFVNRGRTSSATVPACGFWSVNVGSTPTALSVDEPSACASVIDTLSKYQPPGSVQQEPHPPVLSNDSRNRSWIARPANCPSDTDFGAKAPSELADRVLLEHRRPGGAAVGRHLDGGGLAVDPVVQGVEGQLTGGGGEHRLLQREQLIGWRAPADAPRRRAGTTTRRCSAGTWTRGRTSRPAWASTRRCRPRHRRRRCPRRASRCATGSRRHRRPGSPCSRGSNPRRAGPDPAGPARACARRPTSPGPSRSRGR